MNEVFSVRANIYNAQQLNVFKTHIPTWNRYGLNSIAYKARQLWNLLPENLKSSPSLTLFKNELKLWELFSELRLLLFYAISFSPEFLPIYGTGLSLISVMYKFLSHYPYMCKG